ncbi:MAG: hypothetical protein ABSA97_14295 [Verrucomicrobiia bacterium]|jgi:protoheme ferro-lyase
MNSQLNTLARRYQAALQKHLQQGPGASLQAALRLGRQATALDLETLDLARIHEQALIALVLPSYSARTREAMVRRAETFFVEVIRPIEQTHRAIWETNVHLNQVNQTLRERVEMVRGNFAVVSAPGQGTTIRAQIPFHNGA